MKKYIYLLLFSLPLLAASCSKDNYDEPQETFRGKFIDKQTASRSRRPSAIRVSVSA